MIGAPSTYPQAPESGVNALSQNDRDVIRMLLEGDSDMTPRTENGIEDSLLEYSPRPDMVVERTA